MTGPWRKICLLLTGAASACAGFNVGSDEGCAEVCTTAYTCGFLPSALGYDADTTLATADCERRCGQTPRDSDGFAQLLACLGGAAELPVDATPWCADGEADYHASGVLCAAAAQCLSASFEGSRLFSDATLTVRLISFADFVTYFEADGLTDVYAHDPKAISSCALALCAEQDCRRKDDENPPPCDPAICGKGMGQTAQICDDLGTHTIELLVQERGAPPSVQVLVDDRTGQTCSSAAKSFDSDVYLLRPGPVQTYARVTGELTAGALRTIDYPVPADVADAEIIDYCLSFPGMNLILRGGENVALVPFATVADIAASAVRPTACR